MLWDIEVVNFVRVLLNPLGILHKEPCLILLNELSRPFHLKASEFDLVVFFGDLWVSPPFLAKNWVLAFRCKKFPPNLDYLLGLTYHESLSSIRLMDEVEKVLQEGRAGGGVVIIYTISAQAFVPLWLWLRFVKFWWQYMKGKNRQNKK